MRRSFWVGLLASFLLLAEIYEPALLFGQVVRVVDGDTLLVEANQSVSRVRLAKVDAPELSQPYGLEAKNFLAQQVQGKNVELLCRRRDRYGRLVCRLVVEGRDINLLLVRQGLAWGEGNYYAEMEKAQQKRLGLWQEENPMHPKLWRQKRKKSSQ